MADIITINVVFPDPVIATVYVDCAASYAALAARVAALEAGGGGTGNSAADFTVSAGIASFTSADGGAWIFGPVTPGGTGSLTGNEIVVTAGIASVTDGNGIDWILGPATPGGAGSAAADEVTVTNGVASFTDANGSDWIIGYVVAA